MTSGAIEQLIHAAGENSLPISVTFQVTDRCNYDCVHCYQEHEDKDELSTAEVIDILEQLAEAGVLYLTLMGGELFMRRDANDIIKKAHELGFALRVFSTGHHIHDKRADFLAEMKPLQVELSLYGSKPAIHEKITNHKGSWQRTRDAAERLLKRGVAVILKSPLTSENVDDIDSLAALAEDLGAEWTFDPKLRAMENGDKKPLSLRANQRDLKSFYGDKVGQSIAKVFKGFEKGKEAKPLHAKPCGVGQKACAITPKGKVWPCNSLPIEVGDLRKQRFAEIWTQSKSLEEIRDLRWADISECNKCKLREFCQRCHAMASLEHGKMKGPSLEACRHAVVVRDTLKAQGLVPSEHNDLPPTWSRVDLDGNHGISKTNKALKVIA